MNIKSYLTWKFDDFSYYLSIIQTISEGNIGFQVDNDREVENDETHHQMFMDS